MIATITGMICECTEKEDKDGKLQPVAFIYSHGETVRIPGLKFDSKLVGSHVDVLAEIKLADFDGRKYLSIKPIL